jgi:hypothetical protein
MSPEWYHFFLCRSLEYHFLWGAGKFMRINKNRRPLEITASRINLAACARFTLYIVSRDTKSHIFVWLSIRSSTRPLSFFRHTLLNWTHSYATHISEHADGQFSFAYWFRIPVRMKNGNEKVKNASTASSAASFWSVVTRVSSFFVRNKKLTRCLRAVSFVALQVTGIIKLAILTDTTMFRLQALSPKFTLTVKDLTNLSEFHSCLKILHK